jgi:hypothetical protein
LAFSFNSSALICVSINDVRISDSLTGVDTSSVSASVCARRRYNDELEIDDEKELFDSAIRLFVRSISSFPLHKTKENLKKKKKNLLFI